MTTATPEQLRADLVRYIRGRGTFRTPRVEAAFETVPRHLFLPTIDLETAYAPRVVVTKQATDGSALSSASHPNLVATMLEQLDVQPGQRVLEIGTATGINAALLAELTGPHGMVVTIEIDDDLAASARKALAAAGYSQVEVVRGDGAAGHPTAGGHDRIIVTAGAWDLAPAWWAQLAADGRMVVPLRLHGSGLTRALSFDRAGPDRLISRGAQVCGFIPMEGATAHVGHTVALADDVDLRVDAADAVDEAAMRDALTYPAHPMWTGVTIHDGQPGEHLDLWLVTAGVRFGRLAVKPGQATRGRVTPTPRWAGATVYEDGTLAYLTLRPAAADAEELGLVAHGPRSAALAAQTTDLLHCWNQQAPAQPTITAAPASTPDDQLPSGYRIQRPASRLTVTW
jgi:protein-L-isoaspartate(D-aspartate) O-methyltransferase